MPETIEHYDQVLRIRPDLAETQNDLVRLQTVKEEATYRSSTARLSNRSTWGASPEGVKCRGPQF